MTTFQVNDMSCGHCVGAITKAVRSADASAEVQIDLTSKRVDIASSVDSASLKAAIEDAGYTPVEMDILAVDRSGAKTGGCCGGSH